MTEDRIWYFMAVKDAEVTLAEEQRKLAQFDLKKAEEQHKYWEDRACQLEYLVDKLFGRLQGFGEHLGYWKKNFPIVAELLEGNDG